MNIDEVFTKNASGKKVTLAECTDQEFENYIQSFFEIKESDGNWSTEERVSLLRQLEKMTDYFVGME